MMIKSLLLLIVGVAAQTTTETTGSSSTATTHTHSTHSHNPNLDGYCPDKPHHHKPHHYKPTDPWDDCEWKRYGSCSEGWKKDHHRCPDGKKHEYWCEKQQKWLPEADKCWGKCKKKCDKKCDKKCEKECKDKIWNKDCKKWDDKKHCYVPCNTSVVCPCPSVVTRSSSISVLPTSAVVVSSSSVAKVAPISVAPVNAVAVSCPPCTTITTQVPAPLRCNTVVICNPVLSNCPRPTGTITFTLAPSGSASMSASA